MLSRLCLFVIISNYWSFKIIYCNTVICMNSCKYEICRNKCRNKQNKYYYFSLTLHCIKSYKTLRSLLSSKFCTPCKSCVTYTLFKLTSSDGLSGLYDFPDGLKNTSKTEKYKWVTAIQAWSTLLLMSLQYCSRNKNVGQSRCGMFCKDTRPASFIYFFSVLKSHQYPAGVYLHCGSLHCVSFYVQASGLGSHLEEVA